MRIPKYILYRTIRDTRAATGLPFRAAKDERTRALNLSARGRKILARETRKRDRDRANRKRRRIIDLSQQAQTIYDIPSPPRDEPIHGPFDDSRDYGPGIRYAVLLRLTWVKTIVKEDGSFVYNVRYSFQTELYEHLPTQAEIDMAVDAIYQSHARSDNRDSEWVLSNITITKIYRNKRYLS